MHHIEVPASLTLLPQFPDGSAATIHVLDDSAAGGGTISIISSDNITHNATVAATASNEARVILDRGSGSVDYNARGRISWKEICGKQDWLCIIDAKVA